ncbi:hypothetical protein BDV29DRAFT_154221 [Aspergillus leporis]|jgi:hypothetical protein|uniref:Uncharacterized protein n=1 Tax=Aspergillus leporis TaxID=41062 RepID=A0A5N5XC77_9EURO|nr:hypothetical protein BDV29DRAFT_154221 [Aspergillus leporis]
MGDPASNIQHGGASRYVTCRIPDTLDPFLARKFATMNMEAIRHIPERILLYTPELMKSAESWMSQLKDTRCAVWICLAPNVQTGEISLEQGQWVGMSTLYGPLSLEEYQIFRPDSDQATPNSGETRWRTGRVFIKECHRNPEAFASLYQALTAFVLERTRDMMDREAGENSRPPRPLFRLQANAHYDCGQNLVQSMFLEQGARVVTHLSPIQTYELEKGSERLPTELLREIDYSSTDALVEWVQAMT